MEKDKLGIKPEFVEMLLSCNWFCNCGDKSFDLFEVNIEEDQKKALACLNSLVYENVTLENGNKLYYATRNNVAEDMDSVVKEIKLSGYLGKVTKKVKSGLRQKGIPDEEVMESIRYDIFYLFLANYFSEFYKNEFYEKQLQIYLSGHLPCGYEWKKFRVY